MPSAVHLNLSQTSSEIPDASLEASQIELMMVQGLGLRFDLLEWSVLAGHYGWFTVCWGFGVLRGFIVFEEPRVLQVWVWGLES